MMAFKKKTLALVLASVVSIAGSFASGNYKNTLMGLDFSLVGYDSSAIHMIVQTRINYAGSISPTKKDTNTYVLMLPEVDSRVTVPDITRYRGLIKDISIRTMPYTNTGKGYTKITVTTENVSSMSGHSSIYVSASPQQSISVRDNDSRNVNSSRTTYQQEQRQTYETSQESQKYRSNFSDERRYSEQSKVEDLVPNKVVEQEPIEQDQGSYVKNEIPDVTDPMNEKESFEVILLVLGAFLIISISVFLYFRAKDQLREIAGENLDIDVEDDNESLNKNKKTQEKKIRETIKKLDSAYAKTALFSKQDKVREVKPVIVAKQDVEEELNIVDLDELFKETVKTNENKKQTEEEENLALEDFLSGFSYDENIIPVVENSVGYDAEFYEKLLNNENIIFTNNDVVCINKLINNEIEDTTLQNIERYLVSNPIVKVPSRESLLEDLVSTYTISQNILFTKNDIDALRKLMSVELDADFVTDLRTNPERIDKMCKEIETFNSELKKPAETKILMVSDLLPDLSEAVRKQAGKKIQSEAKAETIYFSEGYDVSTLKVNLPDLSKEIDNESAYISKPSAVYDIVDNSYEVEKLTLDFDLPDLKDALENPEKYVRVEEDVKVDEKALLKNISNVQFKPFYDGQDFEVLNHFEDVPSVDDVQKEMSQFDNFEVVEDVTIAPEVTSEYDDFESLYNNEYVDLDKPLESSFKEQEIIKNNITEQENSLVFKRQVPSTQRRERTAVSEELLNKIASRREERNQIKKSVIDNEKNESVQKISNKELKKAEIKCIFAGESYNVLSSVELFPNVGCYLAKNDSGYAVLGYVGDKICDLKQYTELKSEKIQARKNEELDGGITRYIIRIGNVKFIVNASINSIDYVMDLC